MRARNLARNEETDGGESLLLAENIPPTLAPFFGPYSLVSIAPPSLDYAARSSVITTARQHLARFEGSTFLATETGAEGEQLFLTCTLPSSGEGQTAAAVPAMICVCRHHRHLCHTLFSLFSVVVQ